MNWKEVVAALGILGMCTAATALHLMEPHQLGETFTVVTSFLIGRVMPQPKEKE